MRRWMRKAQAPGTPPGTLPPAREGAPPTRLALVTWDAKAVHESKPADVAAALRGRPAGGSAWLRIVGHDPAVLGQLAQELGVHPLVLEDVVDLSQRTKLESYQEHLFVLLDVLRRTGGDELTETQVSLLLFDRLLVTVEEREDDLFGPVLQRLRNGKGAMRAAGVDHLAYALIDLAVDTCFPLLEWIGERLEQAEDAIVADVDGGGLEAVHQLKRELLRVRRATWPLRDVASALARPGAERVTDETRVFMRDVYDHTVQVIDLVETFREMSAELVDLHLSSLSNRLNEVIKVLTIISTIFIPLTFIVGVYGMNFDRSASPLNMPELGWYWGYPAVLAAMLAAVAGMLWWFRRKRWL